MSRPTSRCPRCEAMQERFGDRIYGATASPTPSIRPRTGSTGRHRDRCRASRCSAPRTCARATSGAGSWRIPRFRPGCAAPGSCRLPRGNGSGYPQWTSRGPPRATACRSRTRRGAPDARDAPGCARQSVRDRHLRGAEWRDAAVPSPLARFVSRAPAARPGASRIRGYRNRQQCTPHAVRARVGARRTRAAGFPPSSSLPRCRFARPNTRDLQTATCGHLGRRRPPPPRWRSSIT